MRIVVVDLDGTLIPGNSFRRWLVFLAGWTLRSLKFATFLRLTCVVLRRAANGIDHTGLKRAVLSLSHEVPQRELERFGRDIARTVRAEVLRRVIAEGLPIALVTAAPDLYLRPFEREIPGVAILATPSNVDDNWTEVVGEAKWDRIVERFGAGVELEAVYTDHPDDLPLVRRARRGIVVSPRPDHWAVFCQCGTPVIRLDLDGGAV